MKLPFVNEQNIPVYHLEGGILAYLDAVKEEESLFNGECYVFDQRIAVTYGNEPSTTYVTSCHGCRHPLSKEDITRDDYVDGVSCKWCTGKLTDKQKERFIQRHKQVDIAKKTGTSHIHDPKEMEFLSKQQQQQQNKKLKSSSSST